MNLELLYKICTFGIFPAWLLLFFAPRWAGTQKIIHTIWIPGILGIFYAVLLFTDSSAGDIDADFGTLAGIMQLLSSPQAFLAGWVHYLIFDLFVGAWIARDATRSGIKHLMVIPCLVFTLMLGPIGLLMYLLFRAGLTQKVSLDEVQ